MKKWQHALAGVAALSMMTPLLATNSFAQTPSVSLQFLQNKPEVVNEWNKLISEFEKQNPTISVKQINPPNVDTTLQADVAKGQVPDIIAMGADATYILMARNGIFKSLAGTSELKRVSTAYTKMLENEVGKPTPYAIPYTVNAVPVLYNVTLFKKYHLTIPKTWNAFMAEAKKIKAAGGTPFYNGFKDSWTLAIPWNPLAANEESSNFFSQLKTGSTSFMKANKKAAQRILQFAALGQPNQFGVNYNDANTGFAQNKSVFYVQGIWVLPVVRQANPKIKLGSFVFPATNHPAKTKMVSGVDSLLAIANSGNAAKEAAATKFIDFLLRQKNAAQYANIAGLFSTVKGVKPTDRTIFPLQSYIDQGRVVDFPDHYYPPAMAASNQYESVLQGALNKRQSPTSLLQQMQSLYQQSAAHQ